MNAGLCLLEILFYICITESEYISFPSESEQKMRELEQIKIKLEDEIREQENKLKCEFEYYYKGKCDIRHQRTYRQHSHLIITLI